jgi:hypothetical protein
MVRGSSQQLGVRDLGDTCLEIEQCKAVTDVGAHIERLEANLEAARDSLTSLAERALEAAS